MSGKCRDFSECLWLLKTSRNSCILCPLGFRMCDKLTYSRPDGHLRNSVRPARDPL